MKTVKSLILASTLILTACGAGSGSGGGGKKVLVNGKAPRDYYNQFLYKTSGSCEEENLNFHYLSSDSVMLEAKADGQPKLVAQMEVFLINDDTFYFQYEEREVIKSEGLQRYSYNVSYKDEGYGKYSFTSEGHITLGKWGEGAAITYNDRDMMAFQFRNKERAHLAGQETLFSYVESTSGGVPGEKSFNEYCSKKGRKKNDLASPRN